MDFSDINKSTSRSFHAQQRLIKNVLMGKNELCPDCHKPITINNTEALLLTCPCGKISIVLDSEKIEK